MKSLQESVVTSMDGSDMELFPFLPYIMQDLWEMGASPAVVIGLVRKHARNHSRLSILDLGCGKGAVSIKLAKEFGCTCLGIDAVKEFIGEANDRAREFGVDHLCRFEVDDIRERIKALTRFDIVILGAVGPVFGDYHSTLTVLAKCLNQNGLIIIDDGYIENDSDYTHPSMQKKETILQQIRDSGMRLIDEAIIGGDEMKESDDHMLENLKRRCHELIEKHPHKRLVFENYMKKQEEENDVLETKAVCSTMVIWRGRGRVKKGDQG